MEINQFLLWMTFTRIACMVGLIWWLVFTKADRQRIIAVAICVCLYMFGSNVVQAVIAVGILKVKP